MRKFIFNLKQILFSFIRLFYSWLQGGEACAVCGKTVFLSAVCKDCKTKYFSIEKALVSKRCECCGRELISTKGLCTKCREEKVLVSIDKMLPLFSYRLWHKEILFKWKMGGVRNISGFYAELVNKALKYYEIKNIVPVPPRKGKIQEKGWDQIDELCRFLEMKYNYSVFHLLKRNSSVQQKKLNRKDRLETIKNAYSLAEVSGILPETVCLIDDVCTTGSTIECCGRLLKAAGIKNVYVITLYIVD